LAFVGCTGALTVLAFAGHCVWNRAKAQRETSAFNELFDVSLFVLYVVIMEYGHMDAATLETVEYEDERDTRDDVALGVDEDHNAEAEEIGFVE
jgi:hypothetical protein